MTDASKKLRPPPVTSPTLRLPASPTVGGGNTPSSPLSRQFAHAPYLSTNNIIATEDLNAAEYESMMSRGKRRDSNAPGSPTSNHASSHNNTFSGSPTHNNTPGLPSGKKNVCRHFLNGNCNRGSSCRFYHPGSIHRVITPGHPRTPTQRPLTPLADLAQQAQQQTSAFAATSPVHSPSLGPSVGMLNLNSTSPGHSRSVPRPVIDNASASDNNSSYVSPLSSPANSHAQRVPYGMVGGQRSANTTPPTLSSPSNGPQVNVGGGGGVAGTNNPRKAAALQGIPSLQLPDCAVRASDADDGHSSVGTGAADTSVMSPPHSPTTPGAYRMPVYRIGVRTGMASSPPLRPSAGVATASSSNNTSGRQDANEASTGSGQWGGAQSAGGSAGGSGGQSDRVVPSPPPAPVTRNNPYAYPGSPGNNGVQRQPKEPMSPLKRAPSNFQNPQ